MAFIALVLGSIVGLTSGLIAFIFYDLSLTLSFVLYQAVGVAVTFLIVLWNGIGRANKSQSAPEVTFVRS